MALPKGRTNNPAGRPPKSRALTAFLEQAGNRMVEVEGKRVAGKRLVADFVWEALTTGSVLMADGYAMHFDAKEWAALAKWVYGQVDGPPKQDVDITSGGESLTFTIQIDRAGDDRDGE